MSGAERLPVRALQAAEPNGLDRDGASADPPAPAGRPGVIPASRSGHAERLQVVTLTWP